jgi:hypothetical protein
MYRSRNKIEVHRPRGIVMTSDALANGALRVALFKPGTRAICKCAAGDCAPDQCDALYLIDSDDNHIATFHGSQFGAANETDSEGSGVSGLCVYRTPQATRDDNRLLRLRDALVKMNEQNATFWADRSVGE